MEIPWYIFRAAEHRIQTQSPLSLSLALFPPCRWPKPAIRSHAMCSLSNRGAQLFAGGTHAGARMNDWHSCDLPGWQQTPGMEGCFRTGCHSLLLCHSSVVQACCLRGRRLQNIFTPLKGSFIKGLRVLLQWCSVWCSFALKMGMTETLFYGLRPVCLFWETDE